MTETTATPDPVADFLAECERLATVCRDIDFYPQGGSMGDEGWEECSSKEQEAQQDEIRVAATAIPKLVAMVRALQNRIRCSEEYSSELELARIIKNAHHETQTPDS